MKPRKTLSIYVLLVGVMGLSIVGGILVFQIFSATVKSQLTAEQVAAVKPIDGTISQAVIDNLQQRMVVAETELTSLVAPTPTPTPIASPSGEIIEVSPSATPGALIQ
jgi:membrane-bound ClpP family serine protease